MLPNDTFQDYHIEAKFAIITNQLFKPHLKQVYEHIIYIQNPILYIIKNNQKLLDKIH